MKTFPKILSLLMALVIFASCVIACDSDKKESQTKPETTSSAQTTVDPGVFVRDDVQSTLPEDLTYANEEDNVITFFVRDNMDILKYEICSDELMRDALFDAVHYRNIDVENRLGVKIQQLAQDGQWSVAKSWFETLATAVNSNTSDFDAAAIYAFYGAPYALQGLYHNLNDFSVQYGDGYLDLKQPWWNQSIVDECTMYDALYFLCGDISTSATYGTHMLWFNKDLFSEKYPEIGSDALYTLVDEGKWTIDKMTEYVSGVWDDVNASGTVDDGDIAGLGYWDHDDIAQMVSWNYALGVELLERDIYDDYHIADFAYRAVPANEKVKALFNGEGVILGEGKQADAISKFTSGNIVFRFGEVGNGEQYRASNIQYGILPMPKFDEAQDNYGNAMWDYSTLITIPSNVSDERAKMVSAVIEQMATESYKNVTPAYYSKVIKGTYCKDEADARMFTIALETCRFSFELVYSSAFGKDLTILMRPYQDAQKVIDQNKDTVWPTSLQDLLIDLEELADRNSK